MLGPAIKFTDKLSANLFSDNVVQKIVASADRIAEKNLSRFTLLFVAYAMLGYCLVIGFVASIAGLYIVASGRIDFSGRTALVDTFDDSDMDQYYRRRQPVSAPAESKAQSTWRAERRRMLAQHLADLERIRLLQLIMYLLAAVILAVIFGIMRRLQVRAPSGLLLHYSEAPQLFDMVKNIADSVNTSVDKIYVNEQFNCAVVTLPQLGGNKRYLYVGYPALVCMSIAQLQSILAHEAGHLGLGHNNRQALAQQLRLGWYATMRRWRERQPYIYVPFNLLFFWYMPIFSALAFVMAKHHEFAADDVAKKITPGNIYATSLMSFVIKSSLFSASFSEQLAQKMVDNESSAHGLFAGATESCLNASDAEVAAAWEKFRQKHDDGLNATHPCLLRRLERLGFVASNQSQSWQPDFAQVLDGDAAKAITLLGRFAAQIEEKMDQAFSGNKMSHNVSQYQAHMTRGVAHYRGGRQAEALADFDEAIKLNPSSPEAYLSRSSIYSDMKQFDKAIEDCNRAIQLRPGYAGAFSNRASAHLALSNFKDAIADATVAISTDPKHSTAYGFRSAAHAGLNDYTKAVSDISKSIELKPRDYLLYLQRSMYYDKAHELERALEDLDTYCTLHPNPAMALIVRVSKLTEMKQQELAIKALESTIQSADNPADALIMRAVLRAPENEIDQIRAEFERSLNSELSAGLLGKRMYVGALLREWQQVAKDGDIAINRGLSDKGVLAIYACALQHVGRNKDALQIIDYRLSIDKEPKLLRIRARALHALGEHTAALHDISKSIALEPDGKSHELRAKIYTALGKTDEASADQALADSDEANSLNSK